MAHGSDEEPCKLLYGVVWHENLRKKKIDGKKIDRKLKIYLILQPYFVYCGKLDIYQFLLILIDFLLTWIRHLFIMVN